MTANDEETTNLDVSVEEDEFSTEEKTINESRCYWCHRSEDEVENLFLCEFQRKNQDVTSQFHSCSKEHETKVKKYYTYTGIAYYFYLLFSIIFPLIFVIITVITTNWLFIYPIFMSLGVGLIIAPLMGDGIVRNIGLRNNNILGRVFGVMLLVIGITLLLINGFRIFAQT